jgi:UDP-N-acetyl-D-mannosaminuronic acid dehydrogenase
MKEASPKGSALTAGDRSASGSASDPTICIVGGAGHVGLPLALVLASKGHSVRIYDLNREVLKRIQGGEMPFAEADAEPLLHQALEANRLSFSSSAESIAGVPTVIVTIGTPVDEFMNPETRVIKQWADDSLAYLSPGQLLIFRSTIYPGTTQWLESYLTRQGKKDVLLAYCPERIVQGFAVRELQTLPQIVSGTTAAAADAAAAIFSSIAPQIVRLAPMEAEFAKLFTNAHRYIEFAIANQFYMIANSAGVDYNRVLEGLKTNYPRAKGMPSAGLSAGPCLVKDTMQLAAFSQNQFPLGHAAMLVNEGLVLYLVEEMKRKYPLSEIVVGLLGMAFKADCDDTRSSLSYKLKKILKLVAADVLTTDPYVATDPELLPVEEVVERSDLLILCTPHTEYRKLDRRNKPMIDIWGFWRTSNTEGRPVDVVV